MASSILDILQHTKSLAMLFILNRKSAVNQCSRTKTTSCDTHKSGKSDLTTLLLSVNCLPFTHHVYLMAYFFDLEMPGRRPILWDGILDGIMQYQYTQSRLIALMINGKKAKERFGPQNCMHDLEKRTRTCEQPSRIRHFASSQLRQLN